MYGRVVLLNHFLLKKDYMICSLSVTFNVETLFAIKSLKRRKGNRSNLFTDVAGLKRG